MIIKEFSDEYRNIPVWDIPKFKLSKKDETAIISLPGTDIHVGIPHQVNIPGDKKKSGRYKCFGDYQVIKTRGSDPDACPFCARAVKLGFDQPGVANADFRYGTNIFQYITDMRGVPIKPVQANVLPWIMNNQKYSRLVTIRKTHGHPQHGLRVLDLSVKCENPNFEGYQIDPMTTCLWLQSGDEVKNRLLADFNANKRDDFTEMLHTIVSLDMAKELVNLAYGVSSGYVPGVPSAQDIQGMFDNVPNSQSVNPALAMASLFDASTIATKPETRVDKSNNDLGALFSSIPGVEQLAPTPQPNPAPSPIPPLPPPPPQNHKPQQPISTVPPTSDHKIESNFDDLIKDELPFA